MIKTMANHILPVTIPGINESIYAGFWIRLAAMLLDFIILLPYTFIVLFVNDHGVHANYFTLTAGLLFQFWFNIFLVKEFGGTPGKLIAGIRILKLDGSDVTWREAILRHIPAFSLTVFYTLVSVHALSIADQEYFESLHWMHKQPYVLGLTPVLFTVYSWTSTIWFYSELVVLLFNERRRALHDFIAGTVIVKSKHMDTIREVMRDVLETDVPSHRS